FDLLFILPEKTGSGQEEKLRTISARWLLFSVGSVKPNKLVSPVVTVDFILTEYHRQVRCGQYNNVCGGRLPLQLRAAAGVHARHKHVEVTVDLTGAVNDDLVARRRFIAHYNGNEHVFREVDFRHRRKSNIRNRKNLCTFPEIGELNAISNYELKGTIGRKMYLRELASATGAERDRGIRH